MEGSENQAIKLLTKKIISKKTPTWYIFNGLQLLGNT